jgi:hypothetical protein
MIDTAVLDNDALRDGAVKRASRRRLLMGSALTLQMMVVVQQFYPVALDTPRRFLERFG